MLALASSVGATPGTSSAPSRVADASLSSHRATAMIRTRAHQTASTHVLTVGQQEAAMRAELDAEFNVDLSP
jgi:hypothetical protein